MLAIVIVVFALCVAVGVFFLVRWMMTRRRMTATQEEKTVIESCRGKSQDECESLMQNLPFRFDFMPQSTTKKAYDHAKDIHFIVSPESQTVVKIFRRIEYPEESL